MIILTPSLQLVIFRKNKERESDTQGEDLSGSNSNLKYFIVRCNHNNCKGDNFNPFTAIGVFQKGYRESDT